MGNKVSAFTELYSGPSRDVETSEYKASQLRGGGWENDSRTLCGGQGMKDSGQETFSSDGELS